MFKNKSLPPLQTARRRLKKGAAVFPENNTIIAARFPDLSFFGETAETESKKQKKKTSVLPHGRTPIRHTSKRAVIPPFAVTAKRLSADIP